MAKTNATTSKRPPSAAPDALETPRLVLRRFREADREPFVELARDPEVTEFLGWHLSSEQAHAFFDRQHAQLDALGLGPRAIELRGGPLLGVVGIANPTFEELFTPCVEVGWRLARRFWGNGYATEAARCVIADGFERLGLEEIVAWTVPANHRSRRVMERLGMRRDPGSDFEHPRIEVGSPLRNQIFYRLGRAEWTSGAR